MSTNNIENQNDNKDKEQVMVPIDYSIKHPFRHKWTLWYFRKSNSTSWVNNQKEIGSFDTLEDFWSLYSALKGASGLKNGCDYSLFKTGIRPIWEDHANNLGGRWLINLYRTESQPDLDRFWEETMLCLVYEIFKYSQEVCGAVVNVRRRHDKIGIWTATAAYAEAVFEIGHKLKEKLRIKQNFTISYSAHKDAMAGDYTKKLYTL